MLIGLLLIAAVLVFTFLRPYIFNRKKTDTATTNEEITSEKRKIAPEEMLKKISEPGVIVIDLRSPEEFQREHIIASRNVIPEELQKDPSSFQKTTFYILVDNGSSGAGAALSEKILPEQGYENFYHLDGGFPAWKGSFFPTISDGDPQSFTDQSKVKFIKPEELNQLIQNNDPTVYVVDVRKFESFKNEHIKNAQNLFLDDIEKRYKDLPAGKKIVLYDNDGLWAFKAAVRLFDLGIMKVSALSGGLEEWKTKNFELTK